MKLISRIYNNLLADVSFKLGLVLNKTSAQDDIEWELKEAPLLEKKLLKVIEMDDVSIDDVEYINLVKEINETTPDWLRPLMNRWFLNKEPFVLRYLRQVLLFCYKARYAYDQTTESRCVNSFVSASESCGSWVIGDLSPYNQRILNIARCLVQDVLSHCRMDNLVPSHGPGAHFYSRTTNKGQWSKWYKTIEAVLPYAEFFYPSKGVDWFDQFPLDIEDVIPCRLTSVPKDSRGPRLICVHPAEAIWAQQAARHMLEEAISSHRYSPGTQASPRNRIVFDDQTVNGELALASSRSREYATLDLKEASDRIPDCLVQSLFGEYYRWFGCSRATRVIWRGKVLVDNYAGYAPMGNATTFPVESLVFWALSVSSMIVGGFDRSTYRSCFVFGDDIIVKTEAFSTVISDLESFNLLVNRDKSFAKGYFRESCGVDAYRGVNVTPHRWRIGDDIQSLEDLQASSDLAMKLRMNGYWIASCELYDAIREWIKRYYPKSYKHFGLTNNPEHGGIAEYVSDYQVWQQLPGEAAGPTPDDRRTRVRVYESIRFHGTLHKFVSRILRLRVTRRSHTGSWYYLISSLAGLTWSGHTKVPMDGMAQPNGLICAWSDIL